MSLTIFKKLPQFSSLSSSEFFVGVGVGVVQGNEAEIVDGFEGVAIALVKEPGSGDKGDDADEDDGEDTVDDTVDDEDDVTPKVEESFVNKVETGVEEKVETGFGEVVEPVFDEVVDAGLKNNVDAAVEEYVVVGFGDDNGKPYVVPVVEEGLAVEDKVWTMGDGDVM